MNSDDRNKSPDKQNVEVKRVGPPENSAPKKSFRVIKFLLIPILSAVLIDLIDLATFAHFGIFFGFLLGSAITYLACWLYDLKPKSKLLWSILAGIYCTLPGTEIIPLATIVIALSRFIKPKS